MIHLRDDPLASTKSWGELAAALPDARGRGALLSPLSPAERLVAVHVAEGLSNREIAVALGKSVATVKNQVSAILAKFHVPSRARLIAVLR